MNGKMMRKTSDGKIRFEKEYWRLGDNGQVHYFSTLGDYSKSELVKRLNKLENEKRRLSYELWCLRRIKMNLEDIKDDIENIELLEDEDETFNNMVGLLLSKDSNMMG